MSYTRMNWQELGMSLNDAIMSSDGGKLQQLNLELDRRALAEIRHSTRVPNLTMRQIVDLESKSPTHPLPQLYWRTRSDMYKKLLASAIVESSLP